VIEVDTEMTQVSQPPSWVDRILDGVDRLPVPYGVTYLAAAVIIMAVLQGLLWRVGASAFPRLSILVLPAAAWYVWPLASMQLTNSLSIQALKAFRPALGISDREFEQLNSQVSTLPRRPALIASFTFFAVTLVTTLAFPQLIVTSLPGGRGGLLFTVIGAVGYFFVGALMLHSTRQLAQIRGLYEQAEHLSILYPEQSYAFSTVTATTLLSWAGLIYVTVAVIPELITNPVYLPVTLALVLILLTSFASVLIGVNRRLRKEKAALRAELVRDLQSAFEQLHGKFAVGEMDDMSALRQAISAMREELGFINRLSTWPWQPGTTAGVLSALILPALVVLIQEAVRRLLS
jgi:hypothetical protein